VTTPDEAVRRGPGVGEGPPSLTFGHWPTWEAGPEVPGHEVDSDYGRAAWRPLLGPAAYDLWLSIAVRLGTSERLVCSLRELTGPLVGDEAASRALGQLVRYGLARRVDDQHWVVRSSCPSPAERPGRPDKRLAVLHYAELARQAALQREA
jgi:hypothetical protein